MMPEELQNINRSEEVRERLRGIICWHVSHIDAGLSDDDLVMVAYKRYRAHRELAIIDVNE